MSHKERSILVSTLTEKLKAEAGKPTEDQL